MKGWADLDGPIGAQKGMTADEYKAFEAKLQPLIESTNGASGSSTLNSATYLNLSSNDKLREYPKCKETDMPMVIVTAQVQDPVKWEAGFRTHGDLFRKTYALRSPIHYTIAGNEVAICMEPEDLKSFKQAMESQATTEAMASDGVKRETVKTFVLDKEMKL